MDTRTTRCIRRRPGGVGDNRNASGFHPLDDITKVKKVFFLLNSLHLRAREQREIFDFTSFRAYKFERKIL